MLPLWEGLRRHPPVQAASQGSNATVVGLLLAALYQPVWTGTVHGLCDFILVLATYSLLVFRPCPPWLGVRLAAMACTIFLW